MDKYSKGNLWNWKEKVCNSLSENVANGYSPSEAVKITKKNHPELFSRNARKNKISNRLLQRHFIELEKTKIELSEQIKQKDKYIKYLLYLISILITVFWLSFWHNVLG